MRGTRRSSNSLNKKGVFLAITLVFFTLSLFTLSRLFTLQKESDRVSIQTSIDRAVNLDASLQKSITDLFKQYSGITITRPAANKVVFNEPMPYNFATFKTKVQDLKSFVEPKLSDVKITESVDKLPLNITPKGVIYTHDNAAGSKILLHRTEQATALEFHFTVLLGGEGFCPITWPQESSGSLRVKVSAKDFLTNCEIVKSINPSVQNEVHIEHSQGDIKIKFFQDNQINKVEISRAGINPYTAITTVEFGSTEKVGSIKILEIFTNSGLQDFNIFGEARLFI